MRKSQRRAPTDRDPPSGLRRAAASRGGAVSWAACGSPARWAAAGARAQARGRRRDADRALARCCECSIGADRVPSPATRLPVRRDCAQTTAGATPPATATTTVRCAIPTRQAPSALAGGWPLRRRRRARPQRAPARARSRQRHLHARGKAGLSRRPRAASPLRARICCALLGAAAARRSRASSAEAERQKKHARVLRASRRARTGEVACSRKCGEGADGARRAAAN